MRNPWHYLLLGIGLGQMDPYRDRAALDLIVQAESGMISITGEPGSRGTQRRVDRGYGRRHVGRLRHHERLRVKEKTGKGQYVDVSMLEGQLGLLQGTIGSYMADGVVPEPMGTAYKALLPYQTFRTKTKDVARSPWAVTNSGGSFAPSSALQRCWTTRAMPQTPPRVQNHDTLIPNSRKFFNEDLRGMGSTLQAGYPDGGYQHD